MSDLIFALQILLCGTGEGLTELSNLPFFHFSVAAAGGRKDPPGDGPDVVAINHFPGIEVAADWC